MNNTETTPTTTKRPPIGLLPERYHKELRLQAINDVVSHYKTKYIKVPAVWLLEKQAIEDWLTDQAKKPTRKEQILNALGWSVKPLTCADITKQIIKAEGLTGNRAFYLSGCISSILRKLVHDGILQYGVATGPKGGHTYKLKSK